MLAGSGISIEEAGSGPDLLALLTERTVDLVLLDDEMPLMTGMAVLGELRAAGCATPVVVVSGGRDPERFLAAGAAAHLPKPFSAAEVVSLVMTLLSRI